MTNELLHATLAAVAPSLTGLYAELAQSVLVSAGPPTPEGVRQMYARAEELAALGDALDG